MLVMRVAGHLKDDGRALNRARLYRGMLVAHASDCRCTKLPYALSSCVDCRIAPD